MAALRAERAVLLGFADHAEYVVADQTAGQGQDVGHSLVAAAPVTDEHERPRPALRFRGPHDPGHHLVVPFDIEASLYDAVAHSGLTYEIHGGRVPLRSRALPGDRRS